MNQLQINYELYPKHDWRMINYDEFYILVCKKCSYAIQERPNMYLISAYSYEEFNQTRHIDWHIKDNITYSELKNKLATCDECIIKNIIE
jgi:DNA-directed RNA polymerase subunit M/transcription elongation factor TFIIS